MRLTDKKKQTTQQASTAPDQEALSFVISRRALFTGNSFSFSSPAFLLALVAPSLPKLELLLMGGVGNGA